MKHFLVGIEPLGIGDAGHDLDDVIENDGAGGEVKLGEIEFVAVLGMREEDGKFVGAAGGEIDGNEIVGAEDSAHVRIEMREVDAGG